MSISNAALRPPAEEQRGTPREWFIGEDWYERDIAAVFRPKWMLAGHIDQLAEPGSYLTYELGREECLIRKDENGEVRAYHNVCSHRGARICPERSGTMPKRRIVCPYHAWSFSPGDGSLVTAPSMHGDFDRTPWGLHPVHVDVWLGLVFVCFAEERPLSMADYIGDVDFAGYEPTKLKLAATDLSVAEANWKIVVENNYECYHCGVNHPELITSIDWRAQAMGEGDFDPFVAERVAGLEFQEMEVDSPLTVGNVQVCKTPMPRSDSTGRMMTWGGFWEPGIGINLHPDYAWVYAPTPVGPDRTELRQFWLVAEGAEEGVDYEVDKLTEIWKTTMGQDREICANVQRGIEMPSYRPGPLNRVHQGGIAGFYAWYREQIREHFPEQLEEGEGG